MKKTKIISQESTEVEKKVRAGVDSVVLKIFRKNSHGLILLIKASAIDIASVFVYL